MKEFYPYTIIPQKVEKIRKEGIPLPKLPKLLPMPEKARRKFLGTILFVVSLGASITLNLLSRKSYTPYIFSSFFVALISLVATIFEFVQYGKLKKQFDKDLKHYKERKEAYKNVKAKQEKIEKENKDKEHVKEFQQKQIHEFFTTSYDTINAVHNEYSAAKKRYKLFLEEYFPDEILDNIKIVHRTKKINYIPDFVIQFEKPKLNVAIEIEEPYTLSNVPENIQKDYEAKDRLRQRFANELGWIVIVISEEQAVISPTECCKFVEDSIESIFDDIKNDGQFVNIKPIKKQKMLTGEERAQLKKSKYREKYLIDAGLMDGPIGYPRKKEAEADINKTDEKTEKTEKKKLTEINGNKKPEEIKTIIDNEETIESESSKTINKMKTPLEKKKEIENEQMQLIKRIAKKAKTVADDNGKVEEETIKEPIKFKTEENKTIIEKKEVSEKMVSDESDSGTKKEKQVRREEDILKDLYQALDKHSKKRKEKEEVVAEIHQEEKSKIEHKKEEPVKEKKEIKSERKIKSAAEIILERKQQLEREQQEKEKEEKVEEIQETTVKTPENEIKEVAKPIVEEKKEEIKEETKIVEAEVKIEKEETKTEDSKIELGVEKEEVAEEEALVTDKVEKEEQGEEAIKNQEIIDAYREKIEGAVFDKQWDELIELCNDAINDVPYWDWAYYRRSTAWGHKKDFSKVILDCNKAIGFNPTLADAYYNRGTARFFLGKFMDACEDYQKSIDLNYIKKADAYFNRGLCFQKLDHKKKAYREFLKAKEMGSQKAIEIIKNHFTE